MEFFDLIQARHAMRAYRDTPVEEEKLQRILQAASRAPSAGNIQAYHIYVVRKAELRQALALAAEGQAFVGEAPLVLVFCADPERSAEWYKKRGIELYAVQDATLACSFAMLAATDLGLASVWTGSFREADVRALLGIPKNLRPVALLPVGYAAREPVANPRRDLNEMVSEA